MKVVDMIVAERFETDTTNPGLTSRGWTAPNITSDALSVFGFEGERWWNMGATANRYFGYVVDVTTNECEWTTTVRIPTTEVIGPDSDTGHYEWFSLVGDGPRGYINDDIVPESGPGITLFRATTERGGAIGNETYMIAHDDTGDVYAGIIPDFEISPGALLFLTARVRNNSSTGVADGIMELWCNQYLLYSYNTAIFDTFDMTSYQASNATLEGVNTHSRSHIVFSEWTTTAGTAPTYMNPTLAPEVEVVSSVNYGYDAGSTSVVSIAEALSDDADDSIASTTVADSDLVLSFGGLPSTLATGDVLYIRVDAELMTGSTGYANPVLEISDTVTSTIHATKPTAVGTSVTPTVFSIDASLPTGTAAGDVTFTINSGT